MALTKPSARWPTLFGEIKKFLHILVVEMAFGEDFVFTQSLGRLFALFLVLKLVDDKFGQFLLHKSELGEYAI